MTKKKEQFESPIHSQPLPILHISGTHCEMGRQIGEARRESVQRSIENARNLLAES